MHQIRSFRSPNGLLFAIGRPLLSLPLSLAICASLLASSTAFAAEADESAPADPSEAPASVYVEYSLGVSFPPSQSLSGADGSGTSLSGRTESNPGYTFGGAVGVTLMDQFRTELRLDYRASEVNRLAVQGEPNKSKGDLRLFSVMVNGYYDFNLEELVGLNIGIVPYLGAGIGWGRIELGADNTAGALQTNIDDTDSVFVWNVMVGGSFPLSEVTDITLGYRYVATEDIRIAGRIGGTPGTPRRFDYEFDAHEALLGLRFNF